MNYGHVLGFVACAGVIEMMLWCVSYEMMSIFGQEGYYVHPLVAIVNGVLFFLTLPVWVLYWIVSVGWWAVEGFRRGIASWKNRKAEDSSMKSSN